MSNPFSFPQLPLMDISYPGTIAGYSQASWLVIVPTVGQSQTTDEVLSRWWVAGIKCVNYHTQFPWPIFNWNIYLLFEFLKYPTY
jgi:hypothetical protein